MAAAAFRDVILPLCGLVNAGAVANRQTTLFIAHHGINTVDDLNLLEPDQAKDLVKQFNQRHPNQSVGILIQNNLTGLIWYVKDKTRRALPVDPFAIGVNDLLDGNLAYVAYTANRDKGENIKSLEKWTTNHDFDEWDRKVTETLSLIFGRNYSPIAYVIRPDKPAGWDPEVNAATEYEKLMYQLPLAGQAFEQDNERVFSLIQLAVVQTPAETWIFDAAAARNGRAAMLALRLHYEGEAELDIRATKAQQELDTLTYTNERSMPFETMITRLNKAYNVLKKHGQEFTDKSKVEQLAKRIKNPNNNVTITVAVETMREAHKANYTSAVQYITARMAQINSATMNAPGPILVASVRGTPWITLGQRLRDGMGLTFVTLSAPFRNVRTPSSVNGDLPLSRSSNKLVVTIEVTMVDAAAAVAVVARRMRERYLVMTDDRVVEIGDPERTVWPELDLHGTKRRVVAGEKIRLARCRRCRAAPLQPRAVDPPRDRISVKHVIPKF